jgi:hypothetical protein
MRRELSSDTTFFVKFVLSGIFIFVSVFFCLIFIYPIASGQGFHLAALWFMFLWAWFVFYWCYVMIPIKKVSLDGYSGYLYISNYRREIAVPVSEIKYVDETSEFRGFHCITLSLKRSTAFGHKITFLPYQEWRPFWEWKEHSLVGELKRLAQAQDFGADSQPGAG